MERSFPCGAFQDCYFGLSSEFLINVNQKIIKDKEMQLSIPTSIPLISKEEIKVKKISCGESCFLPLNNKGKVYSLWFCLNGQLGLRFWEYSFEPGQVLI